jgi:hexosaminidase
VDYNLTPFSGPAPAPSFRNLIPLPVLVNETGKTFNLTPAADIYVQPGTGELLALGQYLADKVNPATGFDIQALPTSSRPLSGNIFLTTTGDHIDLGNEGYELTIAPDQVTLCAYQPAGLFRGIQTIRQLLPVSIDSQEPQPGPWAMTTGTNRDYPRFAWRGAMLDVARHFFTVPDVKRFIDLMAYYKLNHLHLHLSDDQGWRIMIKSWPNLAIIGGSSAVGGGPGGYYTQEDYADIVAYAQDRYITVVPEIDMPGHTNAALASYAELNCDEVAPALYRGIEVGFSSLCIEKEVTYKFIDDVIMELAALTPGPYIHIGGDEALATQITAYKTFMERVQAIVRAHGKQMIGWEEIAQINLLNSSIAQHWFSNQACNAAGQGARIIMSSASKAYMDMKYDPSTVLGSSWAGCIGIQDAYSWDPALQLEGVVEEAILGVEAPLWTETIQTIQDIEFMVFPRLPGYAEIGWSPATSRDWQEYRTRLSAHGPRLTRLRVNFYRSPEVDWEVDRQ